MYLRKIVFFLWCMLSAFCLQAQLFDEPIRIVSLGKKVNSPYHETAPLITPDGERLYFSVANHPDNTFGTNNSQDIWYSELKEDSSWSAPQHMVEPLNVHRFNQVLTILDEGNTLFLLGGGESNEAGFSLSYYNEGTWSLPEPIHILGYSQMNKGRFAGATITQDKEAIILYFAEEENQLASDLYISVLDSGVNYSIPKKIEYLSTTSDEFGPFLVNNDKQLYFASDREDGYGSSDIWRTTRLSDDWQQWSKPENLGPVINREGFDSYFSISPDKKLAFTTRPAAPGERNLDIYKIIPKPKMVVKGQILNQVTGEPIVMNFDITGVASDYISTYTDKSGMYTFSTYQNEIFYFKGVKEGFNDLFDMVDLRFVENDTTIVKDLKVNPYENKFYISGKLEDYETKQPISASLFIRNDSWSKRTRSSRNDGYFIVRVPQEGKYSIEIDHKDYPFTQVEVNVKGKSTEMSTTTEIQKQIVLTKKKEPVYLTGILKDLKTKQPIVCDNIELRTDGSTIASYQSETDGTFSIAVTAQEDLSVCPIKKGYLIENKPVSVADNENEVFLEPIEKNSPTVLKNIRFSTDKAMLETSSHKSLDQLVLLLKVNPSLLIEIAGHTDQAGDDDYNLQLSKERAETIAEYLVSKGIDRSRLVTKGYGESKLISLENTEAAKAINRRVEYTVLSF